MQITDRSLKLFLAYAKDAPNWSGTPLIGADGNVSKSLEAAREDRGNITQLKRAKLITTIKSDGCEFMCFTDAGKALAAQHGISPRDLS